MEIAREINFSATPRKHQKEAKRIIQNHGRIFHTLNCILF